MAVLLGFTFLSMRPVTLLSARSRPLLVLSLERPG